MLQNSEISQKDGCFGEKLSRNMRKFFQEENAFRLEDAASSQNLKIMNQENRSEVDTEGHLQQKIAR